MFEFIDHNIIILIATRVITNIVNIVVTISMNILEEGMET